MAQPTSLQINERISMRFVSRSANFSAGNLRNSKEALASPETRVIDGKTVTSVAEAYVVTQALPIQFSQAGLLQSDIDAGLSHWKTFPGLPIEEDEVTPANPVENGRIGVWDSVCLAGGLSAWTDADREQAEQLLLTSPYYGIEFITVEEVKAVKPWPSYDDAHHNKIASLASELGLVAEALAYEQENKQRPTVIEQLEAALPTESGEFVAA
jgi:hypothetical protein